MLFSMSTLIRLSFMTRFEPSVESMLLFTSGVPFVNFSRALAMLFPRIGGHRRTS